MSGDDLGDPMEAFELPRQAGTIPPHIASLCSEAELATAYREVMSEQDAQREARAYFSILESGIMAVLAQDTIDRLERVSPECARRVKDYRQAIEQLARRGKS